MVFALIYSTGCSTGYHECVGIYSTMAEAINAKKRDMRSPKNLLRCENEYSIKEIELDININRVYVEW